MKANSLPPSVERNARAVVERVYGHDLHVGWGVLLLLQVRLLPAP